MEVVSQNEIPSRRLSKVSRLRDMFQNGIVRPIEELEDSVVDQTLDLKCSVNNADHFLRSFPGSPPLNSLRQIRLSLLNTNSASQSHQTELRNLPSGSSDSAKRISDHGTPPARPPKPRNLSISKSILSGLVKVRERVPIQSEEISDSVTKLSPGKLENGIFFTNLNGNLPKSDEFKKSLDVNVSLNQSDSINTSDDQKSILPSCNKKSDLVVNNENRIIKSNLHPNENTNENEESTTPVQIQSKQTNSIAEQTDPVTVHNSSDFHDFILEPDAFHLNSKDSQLELQHAESIAVGTPDGDDDDDDGVDEISTNHISFNSNPLSSNAVVDDLLKSSTNISSPLLLPIPKDLRVVAIDSEGVHILEDGNFFYTLPGLTDKCSDDSDFYDSHEDIVNLSDIPQTPDNLSQFNGDSNLSILSQSLKQSKMSNSYSNQSVNGDCLVKQNRVRFSSDPILVFSTHSTKEYDRKNEDIDPLGASAEYELEKNLEDMELFAIDFHKGPNGLGINIVGSGVDTSNGDQKLSIFIKALIPGGAAEADGRIQVYDQIVQVDDHRLVGVSQKFAAQALRNTQDVVHFVLAREKDPANSRIAKILAEKQDDEYIPDKLNSSNQDDNSSTHFKQSNAVSKQNGSDDLPSLIAVATRSDDQNFTIIQCNSNNEHNDDDDDDDNDDDYDWNSKFDDLDEDYLNNETNINCKPDSEIICKSTTELNSNSNNNNNEFENQNITNCIDSKSNSIFKVSNSNTNTEHRSVLKGTATAASTQRRNEMILDYICEIQENKLEQYSLPKEILDLSLKNQSIKDFLNHLTWTLANKLYESRLQTRKLQVQLRNLEQRLSAQEAAAEEAIERLCLQCRHLEMEISEGKTQSSNWHKNKNSSPNQFNSYANSVTNNHDDAINLVTNNDSLLDKCLENHLTESPEYATNSNDVDTISSVIHNKESYFSNESQLSISESQPNSMHNLSNCSTEQELPLYLQQAQNRARIVTSGGLARRRKPTRVTVNSPLPPIQGNSEHMLLGSSFDSPLISRSNNPKNHDSNQSNNNNNNGCERNFNHPPRPLPPSSASFHSGPNSLNDSRANIASPLSSSLSPNSNSLFFSANLLKNSNNEIKNANYKTVGYQLPGISDASLMTSILRRSNHCEDLSKVFHTTSNQNT